MRNGQTNARATVTANMHSDTQAITASLAHKAAYLTEGWQLTDTADTVLPRVSTDTA